MQLKIRSSVDLARNIKEHTELLDCCEARETHKAAQLLRNHILEAGDDLLGFLQQHRPPPK